MVDTWVKVTLTAASITDSGGKMLDGSPAPGGSDRGYICTSALDLPTGNGTPGSNAVFYVGSLRGDFKGPGPLANPPDGVVNRWDIDGFTAAYESGSMDADFSGEGPLLPPPMASWTVGTSTGSRRCTKRPSPTGRTWTRCRRP